MVYDGGDAVAHEQQHKMPFENGPYLSAALLCERILEEKDGVKSAIRIIDRVTHTTVGPSPPEEMEAFEYDLNLFLRFKSGMARGSHTLEIRFIKPSGESPAPIRQTLLFEGEEDRGVDIGARMHIRFDLTGIHWFNVYLDGICVTRIPLRIIYMPQLIQIPGQGGQSPPDQGPAAGS